ncbi:MAG: putative toxin-antitoxin system toxin component, PIN family [Rubrivivax sp.]
MSAASGARVVVLDTHVVLDWLWFDDPRVQPLSHGVREGALHWQGTLAMRAELASVLGRGILPARPRSANQVLADYDRWCHPADAAPPVPKRLGPAHDTPGGFQALQPAPRCADPDDQKFVDLGWILAAWRGAAWLLTRDRAVLRLARPARAQGLWIGPPERWSDPAG